MSIWKRTKVAGSALTDIGRPLRSLAPPPRRQPAPLPGSGKAAVYRTAEVQPKAKKARITKGPSYTHNGRYQCAPGEQPYGAGFAAAGIGRDVTNGKGWGEE